MKELFRKEAFKSFSSEEGLNRGIRAIGIRIKVFTTVIVIAVIVLCAWLFFGTVRETLTVDGILWPSKGSGNIYSPNSGTTEKVIAKEGQYVEAGDILAIIPQKQILEKINNAQESGASENSIEELYDEYDIASIVRAPLSGIIIEVIPENTYVNGGEKIAAIMPYNKDKNNKRILTYIPMKQSGIVNLGMEVQISPEHAPREEYGYINAYVSEVGQYPVTGQFIKQTTSANMSLENDESYIKVEITLISDSTTSSKLDWSTTKGGDIDVEIGTVCNCNIIIKKSRPYQWIF